jgi:hypothetical protein
MKIRISFTCDRKLGLETIVPTILDRVTSIHVEEVHEYGPRTHAKYAKGNSKPGTASRTEQWIISHGRNVVEHLRERDQPVHLRDKQLAKVLVSVGLKPTSASPLFTDLTRAGYVKRYGRALYIVGDTPIPSAS